MLLAVLGEIEDRRQFLADMECLGQDRAYRSQIETEISQVQMPAAPVVLWWICDLVSRSQTAVLLQLRRSGYARLYATCRTHHCTAQIHYTTFLLCSIENSRA